MIAGRQSEIVLRASSALALCRAARDARLGYLVVFDLTKQVRRASLSLAQDAWSPALRQDGQARDAAQIAEVTDRLDFLSGRRCRGQRLGLARVLERQRLLVVVLLVLRVVVPV